jgi:hypothetical protein
MKIYAFILWPGMGSGKIHALNLAARELNVLDRARIINIIVKLSKAQGASRYSGAVLYRIFKTYARYSISKCYRTYFSASITKVTLINYGLNQEGDFSEAEKNFYNNKQLFEQARKDFLIRMLNIATGRGAKMLKLQDGLAQPIGKPVAVAPTQAPAGPQRQAPSGTRTAAPGVRPGAAPVVKPEAPAGTKAPIINEEPEGF